MLLRPTPLQQPRPHQLWLRVLRLATPWSLGLLYSDALELRRQVAAEQEFLFGLQWPQDGQDFGGDPGAGLLYDLAPHSTTTAPHGTTPALAPRAVRASPLCAPPVARTPSQPRAAVTESKNSACGFFLAPRPVDGILYFSMKPVFLAAFRVDTDFNRDSSTDTVFSTAIQGGKAAQTAFRRRTVATTYTLQHNEGPKIGEPPARLTPTRPENTYSTSTRQHTARSARCIARHAAFSAVQASPVLTTAVPARLF